MTVANLTFVITSDGPTSKDVVVLVCFSWVPQIYVFIQSLRVYLNCKCSNFSYRRRLSCLLDLNALVTRQEKAFIFAPKQSLFPFSSFGDVSTSLAVSQRSAFDYLEQTVPGCSAGTRWASVCSDAVRLPLARWAPPVLGVPLSLPFADLADKPSPSRIALIAPGVQSFPYGRSKAEQKSTRKCHWVNIFKMSHFIYIIRFKGKESRVAIFSSHEYKLYLCV